MGTCHSSKNKVITAKNPPDKAKAENPSSTSKNKKDIDNQDITNKDDQQSNNNNQNSNLKINNDEASIKPESKKDINDRPSILEITIRFLERGEEKLCSSFSTLSFIQALFDELVEKISKYSEYDILNSKNESLKVYVNNKIHEIFPGESEIELTLFYLGLDISNDIRKDYERLTTIIATPLLNLGDQLGLALYTKFSNQLTHTIVKNTDLAVFSHISAFCNGKNVLFLSGGENSQHEYINTFYCIDLFNPDLVEKLPELNEARGWHTMIFVPCKYIFIISGTTRSVEVYDIEKKMINNDSELNEVRRECTAVCVNNAVLYVFCGFVENEAHLNTVEQCNLRKGQREWEYVNYNTSDNAMFEQCYYVCSYFSENSVILFGANENDKDNKKISIVFDFENESNPFLELYKGTSPIKDVCPEKFFHPFSDKTSLLFPLVSSCVKIYKMDENMEITLVEFPNVMKEILE
jgi:hypothetical protein